MIYDLVDIVQNTVISTDMERIVTLGDKTENVKLLKHGKRCFRTDVVACSEFTKDTYLHIQYFVSEHLTHLLSVVGYLFIIKDTSEEAPDGGHV